MTRYDRDDAELARVRVERLERGKPENYVDGRYDPKLAAELARKTELAGGTVGPPPLTEEKP